MLTAPVIVPPVTPWSQSLRVKNQSRGAVVSIFADGQRIGGALASLPDMFVPLDPGFVLQPGQKVTASQEKDGEHSVPAAQSSTVTVLKEPSSSLLGKIFSRAPLSECGTCLWLEGVVPGADITVIIGTASPVTVTAEWTAVHVDVPPLSPAETVVVRQSRGAVVGPNVTLPPVLPKPQGLLLPAPKVQEPLYLCDRVLELTEIRPGARITVEHNNEPIQFCFGAVRGTFWLSRLLARNDEIALTQAFPECQIQGVRERYHPSESVPPPPWFPYAVCAGDRDVELEGVRTGAAVQFLIGQGSGTIVQAEAGAPPHRFNLPPLGNVRRLGVRQSLCPAGPWSETTWTTLIPAGSLDTPLIDEPVYECGAAVGVQDLTAGTRVYVISAFWGGPIGNTVALGDTFTDVPLHFPLIKGDKLSLELVRCGQLRSIDGSVEVKPEPGALLAPLIFEPLDDAGGVITVGRLVPGAFCDIERVETPEQAIGVLLASHAVTRSEASVPVPPLPPDMLVRARQRLCARRSRPSITVKTGDRALQYVPWSTDRIGAITGARGHGMRPARFDSTQVGLDGTDLGVPVWHNNRLYLFFGDCDKSEDMEGDADPIAWVSDAPDTLGGPYLNWLLGSGGIFHRLHVDGLPQLGNFEVPTGAFSYHGRLYVFVAREKVDGKMRTSHLAVTKQPGNSPNDMLELVYDVASTLTKDPPPHAGRFLVHVSPTVVRCADWPGLPESTGDGLIMCGTSLYYESNIFLAFCPLRYESVSAPLGPFGPWTHVPPPIPHPSTWRYYVKGEPATAEHPANWRPASALPATGPTKLLPDFDSVGELSVGWHPALRRWLMSYMTGGQIVLRMARDPRGPWSCPSVVIFDGINSVYQATADNLQPDHQFVGLQHVAEDHKTVVYAPYLIPPWTRFDRSIRLAKIYYTLSTEQPPYNVQLMHSSLRFRP
jgi:Domain of unknown function (DUF4185)